VTILHNMSNWQGKTDGTPCMQRTLVKMLRHFDVRLIYAFMVLWLPFYLLSRPSAVSAQYRYYRHRQHFRQLKSAWFVLANFYRFGQVIMDRFAAYAGRKFNYIIDQRDLFYNYVDKADGFMILSSHLGNFEMAGYELSTPLKRMNVVLYAGDTEEVMKRREELLATHNIHLISLQQDMSHVFEMHNALANGEILAMPADRRMGSLKSVTVNVLGSPAKLPMGPFVLAVSRNETVRAVFVMKEKWDTYHIYIEPLEQPFEGTRNERIQYVANQYADLLTKLAKRYPAQLYNYFDFWSDQPWL